MRHYRTSSRRPSIMSRRSNSYSRDIDIGSPVRDLHSPASGVFAADSDDEADNRGMGGSGIHMRGGESRQLPPSPQLEMRRESKRRGRGRAGSAAVRDDYFGPRAIGEASASSPLISPITSPVRHSTTLGRLASYMGFGHGDQGDEESGERGRARSRSRSSRPSFTTSAPSRSRSPSRSSSEGWGYRESDVDTYSEVSDRASGEEGYTSSLADDTSLPPQSRPGSPTLPLVPVSGDGIFGDSGRGGEFEPKDFPSVAVPSRQTIVLPDEDLSIRFTGYRTDPLRNALWWIGCFLTLGILGLLGRWVPSIWVKFCGKEVAFDEAKEGSWLVVEVRGTFGFSRTALSTALTSRRHLVTFTSCPSTSSRIRTHCPQSSLNTPQPSVSRATLRYEGDSQACRTALPQSRGTQSTVRHREEWAPRRICCTMSRGVTPHGRRPWDSSR